ncbi:hypothetical protein N431DRAFT_481850 [Stipitochalara longipes BDJ]|nr:hypothetical protein N431DRAFT_481850 [Stipitochalara longipes BDJ]
MSLGILPVEILTQIFEELAENSHWNGWGYGSKFPLADLSLSCKLFYNVAQPILYNELWVGGPLRQLKPFHSFLRAITSRPSSVGYIKRFSSPDTPPGWKPAHGSIGLTRLLDLSYLTGPQREWMRTSLPDDVYGRYWCDEWYQMLISGSWDAMFALLLHLFSRSLQEIVLIAAFPMTRYTEFVLNTAIKEPEREVLSNLRIVRLAYDWEAGSPQKGLKLSFILPFIRLKSVTRITIHGLQDNFTATSVLDAEHCTNVTELDITDSRATPSLIRSLILCFHSLKRFHYSQAPSERMSEGSRSQIGPAEIVQGLANSMHCIESLGISKDSQLPWSFDRSSRYEILSGDRYGPIESMTGFQSLKNLYVDPYILLGIEEGIPVQTLEADESEPRYSRKQCESAVTNLPNTVIWLEIRKCKRSIFGFLESLIPEDGPCRLPNLETITLYFTMKEQSHLSETLLDDWKKRSSKKGVRFEQIGVQLPQSRIMIGGE